MYQGRMAVAKRSKRKSQKAKRSPQIAALRRTLALERQQRKEALEQQTATSEILRVIASTPNDTQPVFDAIVRSAAKLCNASFSNMQRFDGEYMHLVASHNFTSESLHEFATQFPMRPDPKWLAGRAVLSGQIVHVEDLFEDSAFPRALAIAGGWRSMLSVPLFGEGVPM